MFFISAREALLSRNPNPSTSPRSGFNEGLRERANFQMENNSIFFRL
jgi:hypothetical protein